MILTVLKWLLLCRGILGLTAGAAANPWRQGALKKAVKVDIFRTRKTYGTWRCTIYVPKATICSFRHSCCSEKTFWNSSLRRSRWLIIVLGRAAGVNVIWKISCWQQWDVGKIRPSGGHSGREWLIWPSATYWPTQLERLHAWTTKAAHYTPHFRPWHSQNLQLRQSIFSIPKPWLHGSKVESWNPRRKFLKGAELTKRMKKKITITSWNLKH